MILDLRTRTQLVEQQQAATEAAIGRPVDGTEGSFFRSLWEGVAGVASWLQVQALDILAATRLSTSTGADVDTWVGDFDLVRQPASAANGALTFTRYSTNGVARLPAGTLARTVDATRDFVVVADTAHPLWNAVSGEYILPQGTGSITVPAEAATPGAAGNVLAGAVVLIGSSTQGLDEVTNASAFAGGEDAESDDSVRERFRAFVASLSRGTLAAISAAIAGVQQGLVFRIQDNTDPSGAFRPGFFTVTVDDGSGAPSSDLIARVSAAVDSMRALTVSYAVLPPAAVPANVSLTITTRPGTDAQTLLAPVANAIRSHIATLGIGQPLRLSRIAALAYGVSDGITNVTGITLNGGQADIDPGTRGRVLAGLVTVS